MTDKAELSQILLLQGQCNMFLAPATFPWDRSTCEGPSRLTSIRIEPRFDTEGTFAEDTLEFQTYTLC